MSRNAIVGCRTDYTNHTMVTQNPTQYHKEKIQHNTNIRSPYSYYYHLFSHTKLALHISENHNHPSYPSQRKQIQCNLRVLNPPFQWHQLT